MFNLGTNGGASCSPKLRDALGAALAASGQSFVVDGRFRGGWITRHYGKPGDGVHAMQMELACRGYMLEPDAPSPGQLAARRSRWPRCRRRDARRVLRDVLHVRRSPSARRRIRQTQVHRHKACP